MTAIILLVPVARNSLSLLRQGFYYEIYSPPPATFGRCILHSDWCQDEAVGKVSSGMIYLLCVICCFIPDKVCGLDLGFNFGNGGFDKASTALLCKRLNHPPQRCALNRSTQLYWLGSMAHLRSDCDGRETRDRRRDGILTVIYPSLLISYFPSSPRSLFYLPLSW